jgi:hypothetical protein
VFLHRPEDVSVFKCLSQLTWITVFTSIVNLLTNFTTDIDVMMSELSYERKTSVNCIVYTFGKSIHAQHARNRRKEVAYKLRPTRFVDSLGDFDALRIPNFPAFAFTTEIPLSEK